jgi:hypothetical protein
VSTAGDRNQVKWYYKPVRLAATMPNIAKYIQFIIANSLVSISNVVCDYVSVLEQMTFAETSGIVVGVSAPPLMLIES